MSKLFLLIAVGICGLELVSAGCYGLLGKSNEQKLNCLLKQMKIERNADRLMNATIERFEEELATNTTKDPKFFRFLSDVIALKGASTECSDENIGIAGRVARTTKANLERFSFNSNLAEFMTAEFLARLSIKCEQRFLKQIGEQIRRVDKIALINVYLFAHEYASYTAAYRYVLRNPRRSLPTTERFVKDMSIPYGNLEDFGESIYENFFRIRGGGQVVPMTRGDCSRVAIEKLYRKYFVGACASYLSAIDASTFDDFLNYLEEFGQPGKSKSGFLFITGAWIDYEVCKNVVAGKTYLDTIYSILLYCGPSDGQAAKNP